MRQTAVHKWKNMYTSSKGIELKCGTVDKCDKENENDDNNMSEDDKETGMMDKVISRAAKQTHELLKSPKELRIDSDIITQPGTTKTGQHKSNIYMRSCEAVRKLYKNNLYLVWNKAITSKDFTTQQSLKKQAEAKGITINELKHQMHYTENNC